VKTYDETYLESKPCAICDHPLPADVVETDGIHECCEEACGAAKELKDCDALGALSEREEFDEVCYGYLSFMILLDIVVDSPTIGQSIVANIITSLVDEDDRNR
jgi:hypothetical protein